MRYWVFKDSQILGPLAKEDFGLVGGVRPETLVCAEGDAGRADADWLCAEEVGELSGLCATAPRAPAGDLLEPGFGLLERLQAETLPLPGEGGSEGWLTDIFSPASRIPAADLPKPDEATRQALQDSQARIQELTSQLEQLNRRLAELEAAPKPAPAPLKKAAFVPPPAAATAPAPAPQEAAVVPPPVLAPLPKVDVPAPEHIKPPVQEGPALSPEESPYRWDTQPALGGGLPVIGSGLPPAPSAPTPALEPPTPAPETAPAPKGRVRRVVKVSAPQSLRKVEKSLPHSSSAAEKTLPPAAAAPTLPSAAAAPTLPPATAAPTMPPAPMAPPAPAAAVPGLSQEESPYQWAPQATPGAILPQAGSAPLELNAPPETVPPSPFAPPPSSPSQPVLAPPPATMMPGTFMPQMTSPPAPLPALSRTMEVPPVPTLAKPGPAPTVPPMTMSFSGAAAAPALAP
ncbi:MAG: hypothetical protein PHU21_05785, partial [Elusimicrobia bacterium]|nr:hypothetical protein [Elusimicrobiota bacterium]